MLALAGQARTEGYGVLLGQAKDVGTVLVDIDDTIIDVHGYQKQGAAFGYSGVRGLNALLATVSTDTAAPTWPAGRCWCGPIRRSTPTPWSPR